jgi:hypothetical protein
MDFPAISNDEMEYDITKAFSALYIFLSLSGATSNFERDVFDKIGENYKGFSSIKWSLIAKCEEEIQGSRSYVLKEKFIESFIYGTTAYTALILICEAMFYYRLQSQDRIKIVKDWIEKSFDGKTVILDELKDIFETKVILKSQKSWLESLSRPFQEIKTRLDENSKDIANLATSLKLFVAFAK